MRPSSRKLGRYSKNRRKAFEPKVDIDRTTGNHPKRSFVPCRRTRFRLPARRLRLRFLPRIWVWLCGCARFTQRKTAASPERAGGL